MWTPFSSWLMLGLGCALSLAQGGRRSAHHDGETITRSDVRYTTRLRENWPEAITETVALFLIVIGAAWLSRHGLGWWMYLIALVGLVVLPLIPAVIYNARLTGRILLPPATPSARTGRDS